MPLKRTAFRILLPLALAAGLLICAGPGTASAAGMSVADPHDIATSTTETTIGAIALDVPADGRMWVEYAEAESSWCLTDGLSGPHLTSDERPLPSTPPSSPEVIDVGIVGLVPGNRYCGQLVLDSGVTVRSEMVVFRTGATKFTHLNVDTESLDGARIYGNVIPPGIVTPVRVRYEESGDGSCDGGLSPDASAADWVGGSDFEAHGIEIRSLVMVGLTAGTVYCAAVEADADGVISTSDVLRFTAGAKEARPRWATSFGPGATEADVNARIYYYGVGSSMRVLYDDSDSAFCRDGSLPAAHTTDSVGLSGDSGYFDIPPVHIDGLDATRSYCAAIEVTDKNGTRLGDVTPHPPGAPEVRDARIEYARTTTTVSARINGHGSPTKYQLVYTSARSLFCASSGGYDQSGFPEVAPVLTGPDDEFHTVSETYGYNGINLDPTSTYRYPMCLIVRARNRFGEGTGGDWRQTPLLSDFPPEPAPGEGSVGSESVPSPTGRCFAIPELTATRKLGRRRYRLRAVATPDRRRVSVWVPGISRLTFKLNGARVASRHGKLLLDAATLGGTSTVTATIRRGKKRVLLSLPLPTRSC